MTNETPVLIFCLGLASAFVGLFLSAHETAPLPNFYGGLLVGIGMALIAIAVFSTHHHSGKR
jgi:hypothetical protein